MRLLIEFKHDGKKYAVRKPNRSIIEESEIEYGAFMGRAIERGVLTRSMLENKYINAGGFLSKVDTRVYNENREKYLKTAEDYAKIEKKTKKTKKDKEQLSLFEKKSNEYLDVLRGILSKQEDLFAHTAERIARNKVLLWLITQIFLKEEDGEYVNFFQGSDFEENLDIMDEMIESEDQSKSDLISKVEIIVSLWYVNRQASQEEIEKTLKDIFETDITKDSESENEEESDSD